MKKSVLVILVFLILMVVPIVFADTIINVKTLPEHTVILKTLDPNPSEDDTNLLEYLTNTTDSNGMVSFKSKTKLLSMDLIIIVEKDGIRKNIGGVMIHKFYGKFTGGIINLEIKEKTKEEKAQELLNKQSTETDETEEVNETKNNNETDILVENETEEVEEEPQIETTEEIEEQKQSGRITGAVIDGTKAFVTSKITYYVVGGLLIIGILFFIIRFTRKKIKSKKGGSYIDFKIKPEDDKKQELKERLSDRDKELADAEKKLQEAKEELEDIKNRKSRLQEARDRFEKAKADLKKYEKE